MNKNRFDATELLETLQALLSEGCFGQGEELCLDILRDIQPDWAPAKLFLLLNLVAQDADNEAIAVLDELSDTELLEALSRLSSNDETETETLVCQAITVQIQDRDLSLQEQFESTGQSVRRTNWSPLICPDSSSLKSRRRVGRLVRRIRPVCAWKSKVKPQTRHSLGSKRSYSRKRSVNPKSFTRGLPGL